MENPFLKSDFGKGTIMYLNKPCAPTLACVYAFEMGDSTVKIGVTQDVEDRAKNVSRAKCQDILRVHNTPFAPYRFMTKLEKRCHAAFADRRVRGEYFNITFEEACAELDSHADEIADALYDADQQFLDRIDYYYNEFLPKFIETYCKAETDAAKPFEKSTAEIIREVKESQAKLLASTQNLTSTEITFLRAEKLIEVAKMLEPSIERRQILLQAANLLCGKNIF